MNQHRYILEPYKGMKTRYHCPACNDKNKTFTLYIDTVTGEYLAPNVGRCNREIKCGYHYTPNQYFQDNDISFDKEHLKQIYKSKPLLKPNLSSMSFVPINLFKQSLQRHEENNFVKFLTDSFGNEIANQLTDTYFIGTSKHQFKKADFSNYVSEKGATIFWQIDMEGKIRTGKIMLYDADTGKRIKEPFDHVTWVHSLLNSNQFKLQQCFFGEHLLQNNTKPVAIVESEKTAVIATVYLPQFIWLAAGNKAGLNIDKCSVLKGRNVMLFPDLNCFDEWSNKAIDFSHLADFTVSDLLERKASEEERKEGLDLADYLVRFPLEAFTDKPLQLYSNDVLQIASETHTPKQFNYLIMKYVKTKSGKNYDLLFHSNGELVKQGELQETVYQLAAFYEKDFKPVLFDDFPTWANFI